VPELLATSRSQMPWRAPAKTYIINMNATEHLRGKRRCGNRC
jgi:hypothetical protein